MAPTVRELRSLAAGAPVGCVGAGRAGLLGHELSFGADGGACCLLAVGADAPEGDLGLVDDEAVSCCSPRGRAPRRRRSRRRRWRRTRGTRRGGGCRRPGPRTARGAGRLDPPDQPGVGQGPQHVVDGLGRDRPEALRTAEARLSTSACGWSCTSAGPRAAGPSRAATQRAAGRCGPCPHLTMQSGTSQGSERCVRRCRVRRRRESRGRLSVPRAMVSGMPTAPYQRVLAFRRPAPGAGARAPRAHPDLRRWASCSPCTSCRRSDAATARPAWSPPAATVAIAVSGPGAAGCSTGWACAGWCCRPCWSARLLVGRAVRRLLAAAACWPRSPGCSSSRRSRSSGRR